ncbi:MAG: hypothetical protein Q8K67_00390 [Geothrix sp.]|nr:hypothetical protein [Geothrix sp.]
MGHLEKQGQDEQDFSGLTGLTGLKIKNNCFNPGALNPQVQHSSERMVAWENTTHI